MIMPIRDQVVIIIFFPYEGLKMMMELITWTLK